MSLVSGLCTQMQKDNLFLVLSKTELKDVTKCVLEFNVK